jgi:ribosome biogenesis GTPase A
VALRYTGLLAANHLVGVNAYIDEEVATYLAEILIARYPESLRERYGFDPADASHNDGPAVIEAIAKRRGFRIKGGSADFEKAAVTLLLDYRNGALGRITVETPDTRSAQLDALATQLAADEAALAASAIAVTANEQSRAAQNGERSRPQR